MNTVLVAMQNELRKIFWRPKYCILLIIYALIGLGAGLSGFSVGGAGTGTGTVAEILVTVRGPNPLFSALTIYRSFLIPLAIFMLSADVITHELESKSIKCALVRPVSRFDVYLAKSLAILAYIAIALSAGFIIVAVRQILSAILAPSVSPSITTSLAPIQPSAVDPVPFGAASPAAAATGQSSSALAALYTLGEAFVSYALTLAPMAAFIAFATFIAVLIHSPALVMFLCIASYIAFSFFGTFNTAVGAALFTTYSGWYRMWLGYRLPWRSLLTTAGVLLSTCVAFFGFGYFIFEKKDI